MACSAPVSTSTLRELLWEPLAVAALNEALDVAAAMPFVRVLGEMFGGADARLGCDRHAASAIE